MCNPQGRCWWHSTPDPAVGHVYPQTQLPNPNTLTRRALATAGGSATCTQTTWKTAHLVSQQQAVEQLDGRVSRRVGRQKLCVLALVPLQRVSQRRLEATGEKAARAW